MTMTVNDYVRMAAGTFVMASVALGVTVSPWFLAFTAFVGANLFQSSLTKACPLSWLLKQLGVPEVAGDASASKKSQPRSRNGAWR